jgi:heat shock protein HtpX
MTADRPKLYNTDFESAIRRNNDNTLLLLEALVVLSAVLGYVAGWGWGIIGALHAMSVEQLSHLTAAWVIVDLVSLPPRPQALIGAAAMLGVGIVWGMAMLLAGGQILSVAMRARPVDASRLEERKFAAVVEEMAMAAGFWPPPRAMVIDVPALNAFASGTSPKRAMITATSGLLRACPREELQGVVAHEMAHILAHDARYVTVVTGVAGVVALVSQLLWYVDVRWISAGRAGGAAVARYGLALFALVAMVALSVVAPVAARLAQFAISRECEYLADAMAVKLTRNPIGLIQALQRLQQSETRLARADSPVAALCIAPPKAGHAGAWMAFHPPLADRIARLRNLGDVEP